MATTHDELLKRLENIFRDVFDNNALQLSEATSKENFEGWDSLGHIRLVSEMEEALAVTFTLEEIESMASVKQILSVLAAK